VLAGRFSFTGGGVSVAAFGFFFTTTPFRDFFMSFLADTVLPEIAFVGLSVCTGADNIGGRGLLVAFSRAATALIKKIYQMEYVNLKKKKKSLLEIHNLHAVFFFSLTFLVFLTLSYRVKKHDFVLLQCAKLVS
jgi:hypothetical protein